MRRRLWLVGLVVPLGLLAALPVATLEVVDATRGAALWRARARPGTTFLLGYTHSSERVPVEGRFRLDPELRIMVVETAFASFGPGLPEMPAGTPYVIRGGMIRVGGGQVLPELSFFVHPFTEHVFVQGRERVALSSRLPAGTLVKVRVNPVPGLVALIAGAGRWRLPDPVTTSNGPVGRWNPLAVAATGEDRHDMP